MEMRIWIVILSCYPSNEGLAVGKTFTELNITELIKYYGYSVETHEVQTEDGYLLTLHRIPSGRNREESHKNENSVIIQHGMSGSSENFVFLGPNKALGYFLADQGYDVWLTNARGSEHSRKHRTMDPDKDRAFWKFS
ncbi:hypothetical protein JTB14_009132 [Gonioctena quinquepunctata]|nr:hypothetical protein JTB14_009132 [Gonioctena quinquepunctata]